MHKSSAEKDNVRTRQIASIKQILNLNQPVSDSLSIEPVWKVLILDKYSSDIISPVIPVKILREHGITLHLMLNSSRETLPDVPAVYFITPTDDNIQIICEDLRKAMYDTSYINMVSPLSRSQLELIASAAVHSNTMQQIQKLADQYLSFISLEDDLFMLRRYSTGSPFSFKEINDPSISQDEMESLIDGIASGLFCVCVTMGVVPIIKCPKDNAAEQVAIKLDQKIRDNMRDARNNLFTQEHVRGGQFSMHRPVLIIADRNIDLATMLHHTWTYQALMHDILNMDSNRVSITSDGKKKDYDLDRDDNLWKSYKGSPFPIVAEAIQTDLEEVKKNEKAIKDLKTSMGFENESDEAIMIFGDNTSKLTSAVGSLPELLFRKRCVETHTNVATNILSDIKQRKLDVLFENEEKILNGQTDVKINELLKNCSDNNDILRLLLIYYLCASNITSADKEEFKTLLDEREIDGSCLRFIERLRTFSNISRLSELHHGAGTKSESMFSNLLSNTSKIFMEGVKNLIPKKHNLPLTKLVDQLVDSRQSSTNLAGMPITGNQSLNEDEYRYFDPKLMHASVNRDMMRSKGGQLAQDVMVFVIGGGNYVEYQNLVDYGKNKGIQRMTYGCTEMVSPLQFIEQLHQLGKQIN